MAEGLRGTGSASVGSAPEPVVPAHPTHVAGLVPAGWNGLDA